MIATPPRLALPGVRFQRETHVSWLFFTDDRVYKIKKPVDLGFLDHSDPVRRRRACEAEVRLNRRLAPDVYGEVLDLVASPRGHTPLGPCPGETCPVGQRLHAVVMVRLPEDRSLTALLARGEATRAHLRSLARRLARFHAEAENGVEVGRAGRPDRVSRLVVENLEGLAPFVGTRLPGELLARARAAQLGFLVDGVDRLADRVRSGRVRDVHGDLHAEHVFYLGGADEPEGIRVIDCIEFDPAYRWGDVAGDVAFLAMSLLAADQPALAEGFIADYAAASADYALYGVVDFYLLYRALVRLKVALLSDDGEAAARMRQVVAGRLRPPEARATPFALMVCGTVATGKTALAEGVARHTQAVVVSSDRIRRVLFGDTAPGRFGEGPYSPAGKALIYHALVDAAREVLASGRPAILDATFSDPLHRQEVLRLAHQLGVPLRVASLSAAQAVLTHRLAERERQGGLETDARLEHLPGMLSAWRVPSEISPDIRVDLDTGRVSPADALEAVLAVLPRRGRDLPPAAPRP